MSGLFSISMREDIALKRIEGISTFDGRPGGTRTRRIYLRDEEGRDLDEHDYLRLVAYPLQLIPAEPGIQALSIDFADGSAVLDKVPVIAWARCLDGSIRVVTPAGVDDGHLWKEGGGYVLMPNGTVQSVGEWLDTTQYDDLEAYVRDQARGRGIELEDAA